MGIGVDHREHVMDDGVRVSVVFRIVYLMRSRHARRWIREALSMVKFTNLGIIKAAVRS